jgi:hypothetical protein
MVFQNQKLVISTSSTNRRKRLTIATIIGKRMTTNMRKRLTSSTNMR